MQANQKLWNEQQHRLRQALTKGTDPAAAVDLFLGQHAALHASSVSGSGLWSFEDEVWQGLEEPSARQIPHGHDHSIAWLVWHTARIEDVTMNMLLAGEPELYIQDGWMNQLGAARDTGNLVSAEQVARLSEAVDIERLLAYREAVGRRTREIVIGMPADALKRKVAPDRLRQVMAVGAVIPAAGDLIGYWGGLTLAGLLLMPPTRHNFIHLNEAAKIKTRLR